MSPEQIDQLSVLIGQIGKKHDASDAVSASQLIADMPLCPDPLLNELIFSMLVWEASFDHAYKAVERIRSELVDLNELRVCTPDELSAIIGSRIPRSVERAQRLILVLNTIYDRHNDLSLQPIASLSKREVQEFLASIDGLPPYAAARLILLGLGWHAVPLDERIAKLLTARDVLSSGETLDQQAQRLERGVRATDALEHYTLLECWAQDQRAAGSGVRTSKARTNKRSATKGASS
jgi:hypothetical protein